MSEMTEVRPDSEQLRRCPVFQGMPSEKLKHIEAHARVVSFRTHSVIIKEGEPAYEVGWLLEGTADLLLDISFGQQINLMTLSEGMPFGWSAVVSSQTYQATVRAREDCRVVFLEVSEAMKESDSELKCGLMQGIATTMSERLRILRYHLGEVILQQRPV